MKIFCFLIVSILVTSRALLSAANGVSLARKLAVGDFDELNKIFENADLFLPGEFTFSDRLAFLSLDMVVRNIKCSDIYIGDVAISHQRLDAQNIEILLEVFHTSLRCEMDYAYTYGFFRGDGLLDMTAANGAASTSLIFTSTDFDSEPPVSSATGECIANIEITDLDFQGDFLSEVLELAQGPVSNIIEEQLEAFACEELGALDTTFVDEGILGQVAQFLAPFRDELSEDESNPLFLESTLQLQDEFVALDFQDSEDPSVMFLNDTIGILTQALMDVADGNLAINDFFRSFLLDEDGYLNLTPAQLGLNDTLYELHNDITELSAMLNHIKVSGLDSLTRFNPFLVVGNYTLRNEFSWQFLVIELDFAIDFKPSSLEDAILQDPTSQTVTERFSIDLKIEDIDLVASLLLVIEEDAFASLTLGPLLQSDNLLPCFFAFLRFAQVSGLEVNPNLFSSLSYKVESDGASGFGRLVQEALDSLYSMYEGELRTSTEVIVQRGIRDALNDAIDAFLVNVTNGRCPDIETTTEFVDFREVFNPDTSTYSSLLPLAKDLLNSLSMDPSQLSDLYLPLLAGGQSTADGSLGFNGSFFDQTSNLQIGGLDAQVIFQARDARIDNLDSIGSPFELLGVVPEDPFLLENSATLGVVDRPLRFSIEVLLSLLGDGGIQLYNDLSISLEMQSLTLVLTTMLKVLKSRLNNFPIEDILDYNCWLATIPAPILDVYGIREDGVAKSAELREVAASVGALNMSITCINCTSPRMPEWTEILTTEEAQEDLIGVVNGLFDYLGDSIGGTFIQVEIDRLLVDAARKCPHSPSYEQNANVTEFESLPYLSPNSETSDSLLVTLLVIVVTAVLAVLVLVFAIKYIVRRRHRAWLQSLPPKQVQRLAYEQQQEDNAEANLNATTQSMVTSPQIPKLVRWGMPFIILLNIALFLSGHLSLGGTVNIVADIAGEKIVVDKFFEFSLARSTVDIWNAGGKELAILVLIFSGIWPYSKQVVTLVVWFLPPSRLSVSRRESVLLWFDRLGKWSMIDIFVLVVSIVAFRVSVLSPDVLFLPENFYSIDILVVPLWGLYANLIAQLVSQVSSHVIIHYHRRIINDANERNKVSIETSSKTTDGDLTPNPASSQRADDKKIALCRYHFGRPHRGETERLVVRPWVNKTLLFVSGCMVVCIIVGCSISSFSLEILGIIGIVVESGQAFEDATFHHSVFTVVELLFDVASFLSTAGQYVGLGTFSVLFVLTVLVVPIAEALALLRQWFSHSTRQEKIKMAVLLEVLQAWQYAEVYIIALLLATWQLGPLSDFMINSYCESLEGTFSQLVSFGFLKEEDSQCFSVKSSIEGGTWILLVGALLLTFVNVFVTKASAHYFHDKREEVKREKSAFLMQLPASDEINDPDTDTTEIHPVPVLFTDTFRWILTRD